MVSNNADGIAGGRKRSRREKKEEPAGKKGAGLSGKPGDLSFYERIRYHEELIEKGDKSMIQGTIWPASRQTHCKCGTKFVLDTKTGYECPDCGKGPKFYRIDIRWNKRRYFVYSDKSGLVLDSYARAKTLLATINTEIETHVFDPQLYAKSEAKRFYVSSLIDQYRELKERTLSPSYQKDFRRMIGQARDFFASKDVRDVRKLDLVQYKMHTEKGDLSGKTVKNIMDVFKAFLRWCMNDGEIINHVPVFPEVEYEEHQIQWFSPEDQQTIFGHVPVEDSPIIAFLILHGCRPGEARGLRCKNIDLKAETVTISATFSGTVYRERRKGKKSKSVTIPLHPEAFDYVAQRVRNNLPDAYVFTNPRTGRAWTDSALERVWRGVRKKAKLPASVRLYDFTRHSFASNLVASGTSLFKVSKLLGHSSTKMTEKYAHHNIENLRADLGKITLKSVQCVCNAISEGKKVNKNK